MSELTGADPWLCRSESQDLREGTANAAGLIKDCVNAKYITLHRKFLLCSCFYSVFSRIFKMGRKILTTKTGKQIITTIPFVPHSSPCPALSPGTHKKTEGSFSFEKNPCSLGE